MWLARVGWIAVAWVSLAACSDGSVTTPALSATGKAVMNRGTLSVQIDATTEPGAFVYLLGFNVNATADPKGHATILLESPVAEGQSTTLEVRARRPKSTASAVVQVPVKLTLPLTMATDKDSGSVRGSDGFSIGLDQSLQIDVRGIPPGASLTIDGKPVAVKPTSRTVVPVDPVEMVERFAGADACNRLSSVEAAPMVLPVELKLADGTLLAASLDLRKSMCALAGAALGRVALGPLMPTGGKGTAIAIAHEVGMYTTGPAPHLADVRIVVLFEEVSRQSNCGTYQDEQTKDRTAVSRTAYDLHAKAYERQTGKLVAERTFTAPWAKCSGRIYQSDSLTTHADLAPYLAWARSL